MPTLDFILQFQLPLWVTSAIVVLYTCILLYVHVGTPGWIKTMVAIPLLCLVAVYFSFSIFEIPLEIRLFFGRNALNLFFAWQIVALLITKKLHVRHE